MKRPLDSSKPSFSAPREESKHSSARLSEKTFNKKHFWLVIAISAVIEVLLLVAFYQWKYIFPSKEVSEIYARYENVEGVDVTFVKDYKVNDTVFVDATMLEAADSVSWAALKKDFDIPDPSPDFQQLIDNGKNLIYTKKIPKATVADTLQSPYPNIFPPSREDDKSLQSSRGTENVTYGYNWLAISHLNHIIIVFHTKSDDEVHAIIYRNLYESNNQ